MSSISRRTFFHIINRSVLAISGLLGFGALIRYLGYQGEQSSKKEFDLGLATDYPRASLTVIADVPALVIHDENGFLALSLVCPHLGCTVEQKHNGFECPCHGSQFDQSGTILRGPATTNLRPLRLVENDAGHLILYIE